MQPTTDHPRPMSGRDKWVRATLERDTDAIAVFREYNRALLQEIYDQEIVQRLLAELGRAQDVLKADKKAVETIRRVVAKKFTASAKLIQSEEDSPCALGHPGTPRPMTGGGQRHELSAVESITVLAALAATFSEDNQKVYREPNGDICIESSDGVPLCMYYAAALGNATDG